MTENTQNQKTTTIHTLKRPKIPTRDEFHRKFAGEITYNDFAYDGRDKHISSLIATAERFNEDCKKKTVKKGWN